MGALVQTGFLDLRSKELGEIQTEPCAVAQAGLTGGNCFSVAETEMQEEKI